ncbi:hypothetical protein niasHT_033947 [Heterodera trifolii]|uniref:Uncharacterized protein n=1 Tax=Heterodera trifolii TaxID=157864 RepID=A0ABD2I4F4_9BILA
MQIYPEYVEFRPACLVKLTAPGTGLRQFDPYGPPLSKKDRFTNRKQTKTISKRSRTNGQTEVPQLTAMIGTSSNGTMANGKTNGTATGPFTMGNGRTMPVFVQQYFVSNYDQQTIADSYTKCCFVDDALYKVEILDIAGQVEFAAMRAQQLRTGVGFLLVFSVTNAQSLDYVLRLRKLIERLNDRDHLPMILVGNKTVLLDAQRKVSKTEAENLANQLQLTYLECSAKYRHNVDQIIKMIFFASLLPVHLLLVVSAIMVLILCQCAGACSKKKRDEKDVSAKTLKLGSPKKPEKKPTKDNKPTTNNKPTTVDILNAYVASKNRHPKPKDADILPPIAIPAADGGSNSNIFELAEKLNVPTNTAPAPPKKPTQAAKGTDGLKKQKETAGEQKQKETAGEQKQRGKDGAQKP